jgi:hypothetical protein
MATGNKGPAKPPAAKPPAKPKGPNYNQPLYQPSQTLSGKPLLTAAQQIANLQIQPTVQGLQGQRAQNVRNISGEQRTDFNYYMQLAQAAKDSVAQSQQTGANLQGQLSQNASNLQGQLQNLGQSYQGGALGRMGALGLSGDSLGQLAAQNQQAQGYAAQNSAAAENFGAQTAANNLTQANTLRGATGLAGTEQIGALARGGEITNQGIQDKINQTLAQRGPLTATALGQLRTQERNYNIAQQTLANSTLNTSSEIQARTQAAKTAAQRANTAAGQLTLNQALAKYNTDPNFIGSPAWTRAQQEKGSSFANDPNAVGSAAWYRVQQAGKAGGAGGTKGLPASSNNVMNTRINNIVSAIQAWNQGGMKGKDTDPKSKTYGQVITKVPHPTEAQMRQQLGNVYAGPLIDAAFELMANNGTLTGGTARNLRNMGVRNTTYNGRPVRVGAGGTGRGVNQGGGGTGSGGTGAAPGGAGGLF